MNRNPFKFLEINSLHYEDNRGHLDVLHESDSVVLKRSFSKAGVFRGLHWQKPPYEQTKIIRILKGKIIDFVAEINISPVKIYYRELNPLNGWVKIDTKLAHGFYAVVDCDFEYFCIGDYNESAECTYSITKILKDEFGLNNLILSKKDEEAPSIIDYHLVNNNH
jgi:dTDP-4-dehydrorhamnose 3,5-epimerase